MTIRELFINSRLDLAAAEVQSTNYFTILFHALRIPGARLLFMHRLQFYIGRKNMFCRIISSAIWNISYVLSGCNIGRLAKIHGGVVLPHPVGIVIGNGCEIRGGCWIYQNVTLGATQRNDVLEYPILEVNCQIMPGACVLGGLIVAKNTRVGANAVLMKSTEEGGLYVGIPAVKAEGVA